MRLSVACCTCGVPRAAWRVRASSRTEASERARIAQQGGPRVEVTGTLCNGRALRLSYTRLVRLVREAVGSVLRGQASVGTKAAARRVEAQWATRPAPPQEPGERIAWRGRNSATPSSARTSLVSIWAYSAPRVR